MNILVAAAKMGVARPTDVWALLLRRIRLKGAFRLLIAFGNRFPSQRDPQVRHASDWPMRVIDAR
jgi:hypothetical protein